MPYDGLFLYQVCHELNEKLTQGRIEKIYQPAKEELVLVVNTLAGKQRLLISANAQNARIHLTDQASSNPASPPMFCMLLRKHLEGGRIIELNQLGMDRVLIIRIECRNELGEPAIKRLICEFMGKHSNIILVAETDDNIFDGIKRYSHAVSRHREVLPGRKYLAPPTTHKANLLTIDEDDFRATIISNKLDDPLAVALQKNLEGLSIPTCRELVKLSGLEPQLLLDYCGDYELRIVWQCIQRLLQYLHDKQLISTLTRNSQGDLLDFFAIPVAKEETNTYLTGSANHIVDTFYTEKSTMEILRRQKHFWQGVINKETKRINKKLTLQKKSVSDAGEANRLRLYGELITANIYKLQKGMEEIALENYNDPLEQILVIPLDKTYTPAENAQAYYKKYNKANSTLKAAGAMARLSEEELDYLDGVSISLEIAETPADINEIAGELTKQGYIRKAPLTKGKKPAKETKPRIKPLEYTSPEGFTVLVGKNNRQNDALTLKTAEDHDIWLHTCKIPGSHVIIRTSGKEVPEETLLGAAALAAYYSKARASGNVPVDYTLRKHVKKPNGAKPGYVIYEKQRTVYVNPDQEALHRTDKG